MPNVLARLDAVASRVAGQDFFRHRHAHEQILPCYPEMLRFAESAGARFTSGSR